jgi:hypothetical protein
MQRRIPMKESYSAFLRGLGGRLFSTKKVNLTGENTYKRMVKEVGYVKK